MIALLGSAAVTLGFTASLVGAVAIGIGLVRDDSRLRRTAGPLSLLVLAGAVAATVLMEWAILSDEFSIAYVAENSARATPLLFKVATLWSALEGSIILWVLVLAGFVVAVARRYRDRITDPMVGWAMVVLLAVSAFFFGLMLGPADPFVELAGPAPADGPGPNPLLQNHPLVAFHPPALYVGYVGFTVPFAFAIAALITGRLGEGWLVETRRWTLLAWAGLTAGIILGAWWSYEVLGWGGYWAWDPVENVSFLPWLTATAYLHSVIVQERRGLLRVWNLSLILATFSLTILGTFITRSGVIDSVHAFAEGGVGPPLLTFFAVTVAISLGLIGWRGDQLRSAGSIETPVSREGAFLVNNLLFAGFAFVVLLGTVFPLIVEALDGDRIAVGTPFFDRLSVPIGLALLFLMAVAPLLPWRGASGELLSERLLVPAWCGAFTLVAAVLIGARGWAPLVGYALAGFAGGAALKHTVAAVRRQGLLAGVTGRTNGGMLVHLGVVVVAAGLVASSNFTHEAELSLRPGESGEVAGHPVTYRGFTTSDEAAKSVVKARVEVDGRIFEPAVERYRATGQPIGVPSVRVGFTEDVYLTLLEIPAASDDAALIRVIIEPMVSWLWVGGAIMVGGTALSAVPVDRSRRRRREAPAEPPAGEVTRV